MNQGRDFSKVHHYTEKILSLMKQQVEQHPHPSTHKPAVTSPVCLLTCVSAHLSGSHLFVHEDVDEWVIDTRALGEKSRDGDEAIIFVFIWRVGKVKSSESIRTITGDKGTDHHDDHPRYFLLCLLGGDGLRLLSCNLKQSQSQHQTINLCWSLTLLNHLQLSERVKEN